jgi:hypothetical protein
MIEHEGFDPKKAAIARRWTKLEWESATTGKPIEELLDHYASIGLKDRKWSSHLRQLSEFKRLEHFLEYPKVLVGETIKPGDFDGFDPIYSLGGDGQVKYTSHFLENQRLITVNSDPERSTGFMDYFTVDSLIASFDQIMKGTYSIEQWTRLIACINGTPVWPLGLNDIGITADHPFDMTRYVIDYHGVQEEQKTSGILVTSGSGSTGWHKKVHLTQQRETGVFEKDGQMAKFTVREEPIASLSDYSIVGGSLEVGERLRIISYIDNMIIGPDTYKNYVTYAPSGAEIMVEISDRPLQMVRPK